MALTNQEKRDFIVRMCQDAWAAYCKYAWPHDMLRPVTKDAFQGWFGVNSGETIVASMSTLWIMGLDQDFNMAKRWVATEMKFDKLDQSVSLFQVVSEYIGGLLACHSLTGDLMFAKKAQEIALLLEPAYRTLTGLPYESINPKTGVASGTKPYMSYLGTGLIEYPYLSELTGDARFKYRADKIRTFVKNTKKPRGLFRDTIDCQTGAWCATTTSMFGAQRDFVANLLKRYIQSGKQDINALDEYRTAINAMMANGLFAISRTGLVYARNYNHLLDTNSDSMLNHTGSYLGAVLALDAQQQKSKPSEQIFRKLLYGHEYGGPRDAKAYSAFYKWQLAKQLTETYHQASIRTATGLLPRNVYFDQIDDATNSRPELKQYFMRLELAESYFILHRLTHDERYREYAWKLAQAIHAHCRTECGAFVELQDVTTVPPIQGNYQYAEFISGTLKYIYLTFCDDNVLPLDSWIFNSSGHPLPICNK